MKSLFVFPRITIFFSSIFALLVAVPSFAEMILENTRWRVALDPATLAIKVTPAKEDTVVASNGVGEHRVSALHSTAQKASWEWNDGAYRIEAALTERDLALTVQAKFAGTLNLINQPGSAIGRGLILPMAEGYYVARDNQVWNDFILQKRERLLTQYKQSNESRS